MTGRNVIPANVDSAFSRTQTRLLGPAATHYKSKTAKHESFLVDALQRFHDQCKETTRWQNLEEYKIQQHCENQRRQDEQKTILRGRRLRYHFDALKRQIEDNVWSREQCCRHRRGRWSSMPAKART
jgi:hypothetical protein